MLAIKIENPYDAKKVYKIIMIAIKMINNFDDTEDHKITSSTRNIMQILMRARKIIKSLRQQET